MVKIALVTALNLLTLSALWFVFSGSTTQAEPSPPPAPRPAESQPPEGDLAGLFRRKAPPRPGEWLDLHPERHQGPDAYKVSRPRRATGRRQVIYLQPLGTFDGPRLALLKTLRRYTGLFFGCPVVIRPPVPLPTYRVRERTWAGRRWRQYHTPTILDKVLLPRLPATALCCLGITVEDLYPHRTWNYVFGEASLHQRIGVYSLARYFPEFWGRRSTPDRRRRALRRSLAVLAHETGHMFSLPHCVRFACLMNGSNSLEEMDRQPDFLCPDCHAKLLWNRGFQPAERFRELRRFYLDFGFTGRAEWLGRRLASLTGGRRTAPPTGGVSLRENREPGSVRSGLPGPRSTGNSGDPGW